MVSAIEDARIAGDDYRWGDAWRLLSTVPLDTLDVDDLDRLATAAYLIGRDDEALAHWALAYRRCADCHEVHRAVHFGMKLAQALGFKGDVARCGGWISRTLRLLDDAGIDCVEQGYAEYGRAYSRVFEAGDVSGAHAHFAQAGKVGTRFAHRELVTLARIGEGRMLIYLGEIPDGVALLDEAMVSIESSELSPMATGDAYCTVIDACWELCDLGRCRSWTESFARWCDTQQELVLDRGHCLLHRAEVLALLGSWSEALVEARRACERLAAPVNPGALGSASIIEGDLLRLAGDLEAGEAAYQRASDIGAEPQPGLSLLRLAQGRIDAAGAMIRRVMGEAGDPISRARLLGPCAEIMLAVGDPAAAEAAATELRDVATELGSPLLRAHAARAAGAVLLARGEAARAVPELRRSFNGFHSLGVRYDAARTRLLISEACDALGDQDSARIDAAAARSDLEALGSAVRSSTGSGDARPGGLSPRELEVLRLVARGMTNRAIAQELVVSEKTVASHVSHIFAKVGVASRSAATAYAFEHDLM